MRFKAPVFAGIAVAVLAGYAAATPGGRSASVPGLLLGSASQLHEIRAQIPELTNHSGFDGVATVLLAHGQVRILRAPDAVGMVSLTQPQIGWVWADQSKGVATAGLPNSMHAALWGKLEHGDLYHDYTRLADYLRQIFDAAR